MNNKITTEQCGASEVACRIINETFLSLDGFEPMRKQLDSSERNGTITFASQLARVVDREIKIMALENLGQMFGFKPDSIQAKTLKMSNIELAS